MTWLDWAVLVCVLLFAIRGFLRGTVAQVFVVLGLLAGLWAAGWVSHALEQHWYAAQPALAFLLLRWLLSMLAAFAVVALFGWCGDRLREAVRAGPVAWLDQGLGFVVGSVLGFMVVAFVVMIALVLKPLPRPVGDTVARARVASPLMHGAADACSLASRFSPGSTWLRQRFLKAERRAHVTRGVRT